MTGLYDSVVCDGAVCARVVKESLESRSLYFCVTDLRESKEPQSKEALHSKEISQQRSHTPKGSHSKEAAKKPRSKKPHKRSRAAKKPHSKEARPQRSHTAKKPHSKEVSFFAGHPARKRPFCIFNFHFLGMSCTKAEFASLQP